MSRKACLLTKRTRKHKTKMKNKQPNSHKDRQSDACSESLFHPGEASYKPRAYKRYAERKLGQTGKLNRLMQDYTDKD